MSKLFNSFLQIAGAKSFTDFLKGETSKPSKKRSLKKKTKLL